MNLYAHRTTSHHGERHRQFLPLAPPSPVPAPRNVADHLRRYWDPRMRKQIIAHFDAGGSGLSDLAREGVGQLARASSATSSSGEMSSG